MTCPTNRSCPTVLVALALLLLGLQVLGSPAPAEAHPYGPRYYSLRSELRMGAEGLQATVILEIPTMKVLREFSRMYGHLEELGSEQDQAYRALQFQRLAEGLSLTLGGQRVAGSWAPADVPINGKGGEDFFLYILTFSPDEPLQLSGQAEVVLENGSFPGVPMYYSAYAHAEGAWTVEANSVDALLGEASRQEDVSENPAGWTRDPAARRLQVRFARTGEG